MNRRLILLLPVFVCACLPRYARPTQGTVANARCVMALHQGDLCGAETECDLGLEYAPLDPELLSNRGLIWLRRGQIELARESFRKALRSDNDFAQAYVNLGVIALREDHAYGRAAELFRRALRVNPHYSAARMDLAMALEAQGDFVGAAREQRTLTVVMPGTAEPHFHLGRLALRQHRPLDALAPLQRAVELQAIYPEAWVLLARTLEDLGRFDEARQATHACLELASESDCRSPAL